MDQKEKKKNVWMMGWTSFFTDVSSEMIFPILPLFLTAVLNANMAIIGLIEGIAESISTILKVLSGWLADKYKKRKPLVMIGYAFSTVTKPLLALATHWTHVLAVRVADRVGKGIRTAPRDALVAASSEKSDRGKYFGIHRTLDTMGAVVGTLIAFFILQKYLGNAYRLIFWLSVIPGTIAILVLWKGVKEVPDAKIEKKYKISWKLINPELKRFMLVMVLFSLANFSYAFFLLRAKDIGFAIFMIPLLYLVYNIVYAVFSIPMGKLSDKIGRKTMLVLGMLLFSLTSVGFAFYTNNASIWFLFALYGLFMGVTDGVARAYVSDLSPEEHRGLALGTYHTLIGMAVLPASIIGGLLWQNINVQAPFIYAAIVSFVAALLLMFLGKNLRKVKTSA